MGWVGSRRRRGNFLVAPRLEEGEEVFIRLSRDLQRCVNAHFSRAAIAGVGRVIRIVAGVRVSPVVWRARCGLLRVDQLLTDAAAEEVVGVEGALEVTDRADREKQRIGGSLELASRDSARGLDLERDVQ